MRVRPLVLAVSPARPGQRACRRPTASSRPVTDRLRLGGRRGAQPLASQNGQASTPSRWTGLGASASTRRWTSAAPTCSAGPGPLTRAARCCSPGSRSTRCRSDTTFCRRPEPRPAACRGGEHPQPHRVRHAAAAAGPPPRQAGVRLRARVHVRADAGAAVGWREPVLSTSAVAASEPPPAVPEPATCSWWAPACSASRGSLQRRRPSP